MTKFHRSNRSCHFQLGRRVGLTLIEIMIALTMTLIVLGAMMQAFQFASAEMSSGRAVLEMSNRLRGVENLLRSDLANLTVEPKPYISGAIPNGYFEYVEGPRRDLKFPFGVDADGDGVPMGLDDDDTSAAVPTAVDRATLLDSFVGSGNNYLGDVDDVLAMTVRSEAGQVFRGRLQGAATPVESAYAEVIWWTSIRDREGDQVVDYTDSVAVFRRVLIVNPSLALPTGITYAAALDWLRDSDVSVRLEPVSPGTDSFNIVANSLGDLANRRNRFARFGTDGLTAGVPDNDSDPADLVPDNLVRFPFLLNRGSLLQSRSSSETDLMLTNVASFDVKVFDPSALQFVISGVLVQPCDPGFMVGDANGDGRHDCTHVTPGEPSENEPDLNGDGINDSTTRSGAFADLGHIDFGINAPGSFAVAAGLGGVGQFSQTASPLGLFVSGLPFASVPRAPLNYQFNFHQGAGVPASLVGLLDTVYDTWTPGYESDGINQDPNAANYDGSAVVVQGGDGLVDEGTDGLDTDLPAPATAGTKENGVDDYNERETQPPYPDPIRGLQVTLRLVEKNTNQIQQTTVTQSFVPE